MDIIDLLVADHNRVRGLISRYKDADEADDTNQASQLADAMIRELNVHMVAEESVFYQAVRKRTNETKGVFRFQWGVDDVIFGGLIGFGHVTPPA
jgi:Hemerythrin HHE cation binding domain